MMNLMEYLSYRKDNDEIDEFDMSLRSKNAITFKKYIDEYFFYYLNRSSSNNIPSLDKVIRFEKQLKTYDEPIKFWLSDIYRTYGVQLNRLIINLLKSNNLFLLYHNDDQFIEFTTQCHSELLKKQPFLESDFNKILSFIKFRHRLLSNEKSLPTDFHFKINNWLKQVKDSYNVNIIAFIKHYIRHFSDNPDTWPVNHRMLPNDSERYFIYNYKQKSNLFNLDHLYEQLSHIEFMKNKKSYLEYLMMYEWLDTIDSNKIFWEEYHNNHELYFNSL